ncbi:MAG: hypothetical protein LAQ30_01885 [Acidobacteriia bacterium]|nr:hypothetical protein [Terriglobia bacterium]
MEFRLIYRGALPAETNKPRTKSKREIRSQIHPQLKELWNSHPALKVDRGNVYPGGRPFSEYFGDKYKVVSGGNHIHRFVPLITRENYHGCSLKILFLRRDMPGGIVKHGGDIDNRLKVLFDALRMPRETQEVEDFPQPADENPCFCLLADDQYIDEVAITTDRLLSPVGAGGAIHDVVLVIHVAASLYDPERDLAAR